MTGIRFPANSCAPTLAPLCAVDIVEGGRVARVATAAPSHAQRDLLASHIPVYDAAVGRVLACGTSEGARGTPTGPGPWRDLARYRLGQACHRPTGTHFQT
ncbi:hypothetical protein [Streptomyces graminofaciens]|nr:hypothetical protein [Streptomyces graminofaciens]